MVATAQDDLTRSTRGTGRRFPGAPYDPRITVGEHSTQDAPGSLAATPRSRVAFLVSLIVVATLVAIDVGSGPQRIVTATLVLGPFLAGVLCTVRETVVVAALACLCAALSFLWTENALSGIHAVREAVVYAGSVLAYVAARERARSRSAERQSSGLSSDLAEAERLLGVALGAMAGAVMIQRPGQGIVYANQASADAVGLPDPAAVVAATPEEIARGWESWKEDGSPLVAEDYPSRKILTGTDLAPAPLISRAVHRATGREQWSSVRATAVLDEAGDVVMAVSVTEDITAIKRGELVQRLLADAGRVLASSLEVDETLRQLARLVVPELADWCSISLPGRDGLLRVAAIAHRDPERVAFAEEYSRRFPVRLDEPTGAPGILRGEPSQLVPEIPDELLVESIADPEQLAMLREIGMTAVMLVPVLPPAGPPLGVLTLVQADSGRVFGPADLELAEELGRRAGVALQNAELYEERTRIAATLQNSLLPDALPDVPGHGLAATYRPAGRTTWVGGDFYDAFPTARGWMVIMGDVAGQGASAAALTALSRHSLRSAGILTGDPVTAVGHLNAVMAGRAELSLCTVCVVLLGDPADPGSPARVVCAGHPLPVLVRGGDPREVGVYGPIVGAEEDAVHRAAEVALEPGDVLVLYTDGVLDAVGRRERFGPERLHAALADARDAEGAVRAVLTALDRFQVGEQADDTAVLAVGRLPA